MREFIEDVQTPYEGYPTWMLVVFGWGSAVAVIIFAVLASRVRWRPQTPLTVPDEPEPVNSGREPLQ